MQNSALGVILAGGQARRMGGGDKLMIELSGRRLVDHILDRLNDQIGAVVLNANGPAERFDALGLDVVSDSITGFAGPLAGVLAGLDAGAARGFDRVVTIAGDTPFFPRGLVRRLELGSDGFALAATQSGDTLHLHPTFGLWPVALREPLRQALIAGTRKVLDFTEPYGAVPVVFDAVPFDPFFNINTQDDIEVAGDLVWEHGL